MKSQRGQASVEAVLAVVIIAATAIFVSKQFRSNGLFANLVEGPWSYIDGMTQHGVWGPAKKAKTWNPATSRRVSSQSEPER